MSHIKPSKRATPMSNKTPLVLLEALPGALFVINDEATIIYANASAQAITGATREHLFGMSLWNQAPQLVSTSLYQAIQQVRQTRASTEVEYVSPVTGAWLHASLSPTDDGLAIFFRETLESHHQHTLNQNNQMDRDLLESFVDGVTIVTSDGLILDINQRPLADAHLRREEVIGKPFAELPAWSHDPAVQQQLRVAIERASQGEIVRFEARIHPRTDLYLDILMTIASHRDANQQVEYLVCAGRDITERKMTEDERRTLVDAIPQIVWIAGPDGSITYNNQRLIDYLALTHEQAEGNGWMAAVHPDDRQRVWEVWQTAVQTGVPYEVEHRLQDGTSGAYHWFLIRGEPQKTAQGTIQSWIGTCTNIDEQKSAEEWVRASEQNFRMLAEAVPQLVWTMLPDGHLEYANQRYRDWTQADLELSRDDFWCQCVHPEDIERVLMLQHRSLATGELYENEYRLRNRQTGEYRWFLGRAIPMRDATGQILKWFGTCTDIDEQKHTEEALRQSQERVNILMNSSIIGINVSEGEQIVDANDTFLRMIGYTREDLRAGRINWMQMTPPEYVAQTLQAHQQLDTQQAMTPYEKEYVCKDGSRLPVIIGRVALPSNPCQGIAFVLDNSARKELDQRKDDFLNMASHELRNPITALKLQIALLQRKQTKHGSDDLDIPFTKIETQLNTISRLVEELLDVSKIQAGRLEYRQQQVDLTALLREITDTMQSIHPSHTMLLDAAVQVSLMGDRDRLGQVFTNLINNAIKYSPNAKTVEVNLDATEDAVTIRVHDHGVGIPREQREKIFERFYRVGGPGQRGIAGLGMGLYIVAEIVKHHGGTITVDSTVGESSTFTVALPLTRDA